MKPFVLSRRSKLFMLSGASALALVASSANAQTLSGLKGAMGLPSAGSASGGGAPASGAGTPLPASALTPAQAAQLTSKSSADLSRAISALKAQLTAQANAQAAAQSKPNTSVPNGLGAGGLAPAAGISGDPSLWQGANAPTQATANGVTTVTIDQTQSKAILTWDSFNVGQNTIVHFDQTGGTQTNGSNTWIALNRIVDPNDRPTQILGQIKAEGSVYLINQNGIIFGAGSQVNVHSLVASSLSFLGENITGLTPGSAAYDNAVAASNATFLSTGFAGPEATGVGGFAPNLVLGVGQQPPAGWQAPGDVVIEQGASITTHANGSQGDGGFALIAGLNVTNAGVVDTPDGQAILAAGIGVAFNPRQSAANVLSPVLTGMIYGGVGNATPISTMTNTGLVEAARGTIDLLGTNVTQGGVVVATTGVSYPGSIVITAADGQNTSTQGNNGTNSRAGVAEFTQGSVTANLPEEDGETATSSPTSTFTPGSIAVTGGSVTFDNGSLVEAPGAKVTVAALISSASGRGGSANPGEGGIAAPPAGDTAVQGRVYVDNGATIDVAGLTDVQLPISATLVTIPLITQNDIADNPNEAALLGLTNIIVDSTLAGTTSNGQAWVGTPILGAGGYAQLVPRKIDQLLTNAGSIQLSGGEVVTAAGSMLNLDGGYTHYLGGVVATTELIDKAGHIVPIGQANPNDVYVGVVGETMVNHGRWGVTDTYINPLMSGRGGYYQSDYVAGGNAGVLTVFGESVVLLDGDMSAQVVPGLKQAAAGAAPSGTAGGGGFLPTGGTFDLGDGGGLAWQGQIGPDYNQTGKFIIQNQAPQLTSFDQNFNADTAFDATTLNALDPNDPINVLSWRTLPADTLNAGGFANIKLNAGDGTGVVVAKGVTLQVQAGGSISFTTGLGSIDVEGSLIAPSGTISLQASDTSPRTSVPTLLGYGITVGSQAVLSTAGLWVNDSDLVSAPGAQAFVNGGTISLSAPGLGTIDLEQGSVLDVSSGGVLLQGGLSSSNGVPVGKGGNVTLSTWNIHFSDNFSSYLPTDQPTSGGIVMDGTIKSWGFSGGGTLTLQTLGIQIGGDPATAPAGMLVLPTNFFASQGFGNYQLNAMYDATIADGAQVRLTQQNFIVPNSAALAALASEPTGADITEGGVTQLGQLDAYHRQATNLTMTAGGDIEWMGLGGGAEMPKYAGVANRAVVGAGAVIDADAGASITLGGTGGVTVLGTIRAHGGSITLTSDTDYAKAAGMATNAFTTPDKSVWLGSDAVLDVSGTTLVNPAAKPGNIDGVASVPSAGKVLDGGSVTLSSDTGAVVAQAGSVIDVSGASSTFDMPQIAPDGSVRYVSQPVWSNAGSITLGAGRGLFFDGALEAQAGSAQADGGTLTLLPEAPLTNGVISTYKGGTLVSISPAGLILQQSGELVPAGLEVGQAIPYADPGSIRFSADRLDGSGISTLVLGGAATTQNSSFTKPVPLAFAGDVTLSLARAVVINASQIEVLPDGTTSIPALTAGSTDTGGATVNITAPYVEIAGPAFATSQLKTIAATGDGTLNVNAGFIDLENQVGLTNFGQVNLTSSGDIRLSSVNGGSTSSGLAPGVLFTTGDLTLKAADIYPASGETFIIDAVGPNPTTVTIEANGASTTPLSAGGALLIDATNIVQSGTIRAPFGGIILGVGDPSDSATQTAFSNLPLTATQSVTLTDGSITSVSADGMTLPYGVTTDGTEWTYPAFPTNSEAPALTAPPSKIITLSGTSVTLAKGATVDLAGGGQLQAEEWTPGTGGTRDLLSQYNISYAASTSGQVLPLYPDARNVYAVIPGYSAPVAAYDPVFAQSPDPKIQGQIDSLGVGQAGTGDLVGKAVYLSGVPGLPAGVYTLLPAKYATLPGAFRVVQETSASNVAAGSSSTLTDGTHVVAGYFADAITGAQSSTVSLFDVQPASVWGKYSQYTLTPADTFFANQAAAAGTAAPALPRDAGSLTLAATTSLTLGATLNTGAATGGAPAQVNIASQDIQIVGQGETALAGYLQINASDLDSLNAGSLLIGGSRTRTSAGDTINVLSNSVVVSNDADHPLTGSEIILVAKSDPTGSDPNAANGLRIDSGSVITATGSLPASADQPITIGSSTASGDGALLRVSQGGQVDITRNNVPASGGQGSLTVAAGATVNGGAALTLDSSGALSFDPTASFSGTNIAVDAPTITVTNATGAAAPGSGFVVGPENFAQFSKAQEVSLRSYGSMVFDGDVALTFGQAVELSAGSFVTNGGSVSLTGPKIAFTNDLNASGAAAAGQGSLSVNATEIDLGTGAKALSGFGSVNLTATGGIVGQDTGSFDAGAATVNLSAPVFIADTGSATTLKTTGALTLTSNSGTALKITPVGGAIGFTGGTVMVDAATLEAPAGNVSLEATSGDLTIASGSLVSSAGVAKTFYDTTQYAPAGAITLVADHGQVNVQSGSTVDFSGAAGGGAAGSLTLLAPDQTVLLNGVIKGGAASGYLGGSLTLTTGGTVDFTSFAAELASSGVNDAISVQTGAGNLVLAAGQTLKAQSVILVADGGAGGQDPTGGNVQILGTIDASGLKGGSIGLYGKSGVDVEGSLLATGSSPVTRGGTVEIGVTGQPNTVGGVVQLDPTYGYELVSSANSGSIKLGANAVIDVSGGTAGGLSGGTVNFRAPLLDNGDVNITLASGAQIRGSRATTLEAYAVWSTDDPTTYGQDKHFDGVVDPAGWYTATGALLAGTFTDASGNTLATWDGSTLTNSDGTTNPLSYYLSNAYFAPNAANTDHQTFYGYKDGDANAAVPGTLMGFVENFPISQAATARFAGVQNFAVTPGIELDNPDPNINGGNITVLTAWNLGAGSSPGNLAYRYNGQAPVITFKAENDFKADASLSDGFFQIKNPISPGTSQSFAVPGYQPLPTELDAYNNEATGYFAGRYTYNGHVSGTLAYYGAGGGVQYGHVVTGPGSVSGGTLVNPSDTAQGEINAYLALYKAYADFLLTVDAANGGGSYVYEIAVARHYGTVSNAAPTPPSAAAQAANPLSYVQYLQSYLAYFQPNYLNFLHVDPPAAPIPELVSEFRDSTTGAILPPGTVINLSTAPTTNNTPSPQPTGSNPLPLTMASLNSGPSSSFRVVAGANLASADPLAVQPATASSGSVTLDGHFAYTDANGQAIYSPTMIRTGSGSIEISASNDVSLLDTTAPGVVYTAGTPAAGAPVSAPNVSILASQGFGAVDLLVTNAVNPEAAGDISIHAGNDIVGVETVSAGSSAVNQFWYQWMQTGNTVANGQITQTSINFGAFDQGVMSIGGDVAVSAGGNIVNLAVSLPTTWYLSNNNMTVNTVGGGDLTVTAGGDILSGDYFVAKGTGTLTAGGKIGSSGLMVPSGFTGLTALSTLLATQDGVLNVTARQGVDIAGMVDPSYVQGPTLMFGYKQHVDAQSYSSNSALNVVSTTGDVVLNSLGDLTLIGSGEGFFGTSGDEAAVLPSNVSLTAFSGGISVERGGMLYPSARGELSLIADQSIALFGSAGIQPSYAAAATADFGLIDAPASTLPSPLNPLPYGQNNQNYMFNGDLTSSKLIDHSPTPLHADDTQPVRIYSLEGSITDGALQSSGFYQNMLIVAVDKPAQIYAGQDIVNLDFLGQNLREDDITRIVAGRDILTLDQQPFAQLFFNGISSPVSLNLGGPGTFDVEAGRNISLPNPGELSSVDPYLGTSITSVAASGIVTVGNANNPYLPHESASINVLFGVGPGVDNPAFIAAYVDPTVATPLVQSALVSFMATWDEGQDIDTGLVKDRPVVTLTVDQAWSQFQALPAAAQALFNQKALFAILTQVDVDYNDPTSPNFHKYARGYQAINTLFPSGLGYTANALTGGVQGADTLVQTGNLDIRSSTIQTQQGGNITILGPGGQALVGAAAAPPAFVNGFGQFASGPSNIGILTLEQGDVDVFTDRSLLLAQSRIFTEQGGNMTMWSSNGDINAGKGAKTTADVPGPIYVCDGDFYCTRDARGEVTGAGIATLQTIPGTEPGNVYLVAPRGTVDAGAAGIRVSGNIYVAALAVANAANIQVQGVSFGLPPKPTTNLSLATPDNASKEVTQLLQQMNDRQRRRVLDSIVDVQVVGFGGADIDHPDECILTATNACKKP